MPLPGLLVAQGRGCWASGEVSSQQGRAGSYSQHMVSLDFLLLESLWGGVCGPSQDGGGGNAGISIHPHIQGQDPWPGIPCSPKTTRSAEASRDPPTAAWGSPPRAVPSPPPPPTGSYCLKTGAPSNSLSGLNHLRRPCPLPPLGTDGRGHPFPPQLQGRGLWVGGPGGLGG